MSHAPSDALDARHRTVRQGCRAAKLDALVVTSLPNVTYLSNFTGSAAIVVITADRFFFVTDFRYLTAVTESQRTASACPSLELVRVAGSYDVTLATLLKSMPDARVGFEAAHLTVSRHDWLAAALADTSVALVPALGIVEQARIRKDGYERRTLETAAAMLAELVPDAIAEVRPGRSERETAFGIDARIHRAGFERTAFETIVAAGPNGALPHAHPGERTIREGDLVVLDFGGVYDSYCVDLTRTVSVGAADSRTRDVYSAVLAAHDRAIQAVRPGASRFAVDAAARDELTRRGFGDAFGHGTGHGLGIEVHEEPRVGQRRPDVDTSEEALAPDMVFTIEPGVYLPDWGGVRIEDDVLVTGDGVKVLTNAGTELVEL